ncbi:MAG: BREX-1 system adenine-specific DNA-methyltransferase PglX, partial [Desulfamplus sp.]|nr:BREX-1 system adenine-specific DNA-methyltransferase PglX [Desulfamplus sp.]
MNTSQIKAYAPKARTDFIEAVTEKAARYGIHKKHIEPIRFEGDVAIIGDKAVSRTEGEQRERLVRRVNQSGFEMFIRSSAYTWFNRFVAIRYMELHDFLDHGYRVLSSPDGSLHPEIIGHAADVDLPGLDKDTVIELKLAGDRDNELFRMLLIAQCNALHNAMPFLFGKVDNEEELLLPDNLLHTGSPLHNLVTEVDEELWEDVEIIGWIYQFYISEKKDEVIGKQVKSEDIPAATQLFTPNWIVKYMVQNTLGRMWLATYPDSSLRNKMEYYIEPAEQEPDVQKELDATIPKELDPETLTFLDPACGSGHILVEAYDILKEIYLERGYRTREIPRLILEKNLFGLDIDDRAAQLANFAVMMRARNDDRRLFTRDDLKTNILSITESKGLDQEKLKSALKTGRVKDHALTSARIQELIELFHHAKTFGSLLTIPDEIVKELDALESIIESSGELTDDLIGFISGEELGELMPLVKQAQLLSKKYDCVVANPPYMGSKGMNPMLKAFAKKQFPDSKSDLFAISVERIMDMVLKNKHIGVMTPFTWMFLSSYEKLRSKILFQNTLTSLIRPEYHAFFDSAYVPVCTFIMQSTSLLNYKASFIDLSKFYGAQLQAPKTLEAIQNPDCGWFFNASAGDFKKIPGSPVAYWIGKRLYDIFINSDPLGTIASPRAGLATGDNITYQKYWSEVSFKNIAFDCQSNKESQKRAEKWYPCNSGGHFRKWFGNNEILVNWQHDGHEIRNFRNENGKLRSRPQNTQFYFRPGITWTKLSSSSFAARLREDCFIFDDTGRSAFPKNNDHIKPLLAFLCSKLSSFILNLLNPSMSFTSGDISNLPILLLFLNKINNDKDVIDKSILISKKDWDAYETSWDFTNFSLLYPDYHATNLSTTYTNLHKHWQQTTFEMQHLEEENNRIFIEAYGLEDELTPEVPLHEITLT